MANPTAGDFKQARFATKPEKGGECRAVAHSGRSGDDRWIVDCAHLNYSDIEMAANGWTPVSDDPSTNPRRNAMNKTPIPAPPGKKLDWIINTWADHRIVEHLECEDGYKLSVQASGNFYCDLADGTSARTWDVSPRALSGPVPLPFRSVEVKAENVPEAWLSKDIDGEGGESGEYGWVPVEEVRAFIASHGGEKGASKVTQFDRIEALLEKIAENTAHRETKAVLSDRVVFNFTSRLNAVSSKVDTASRFI